MPRPNPAPRPPALAAGGQPSFLSTQVTEIRRYFLNLTPKPTRHLEVVCGGVERCRHDYAIQRANFPYLGLEFVAEGDGRLTLNGREYALRPGCAFAYGPGVRHAISNVPQRPMLKYYVDFVGEAGRRLLAESALADWKLVQVASPNEVAELFEALHRSATVQSDFSRRICACLLEALVLKISEQAVSTDRSESRAFPTYQRVARYMEQHVNELKTAEDVARACHINASYLCRLFQRFHHHSPYQFLLRLKMSQAATLLLDEGLRVKETADRLGFGDQFNFSRTFKLVYGVSPEQFVKVGRRLGES